MHMQASENFLCFNPATLASIVVAFQGLIALTLPSRSVEHPFRAVGLKSIPARGVAENSIRSSRRARWSVNLRSAFRASVVGDFSSGDSSTLSAAPSLTARAVSRLNHSATRLAGKRLAGCNAIANGRAIFTGACPCRIKDRLANQAITIFARLIHAFIISRNGRPSAEYIELAQRRIEIATRQRQLFSQQLIQEAL